MKKLLVLLLTLILSLGAFTIMGCNGGGNTENPEVEVEGTAGLNYSILSDANGNQYAVFTGVSSSCTEKDIVIASHYQGHKVTEIGWFMDELSGMQNVETVEVHKYVTSIASSAFIKAENLKTITFDKECELTLVDNLAFKNLKKLENFNYYGILNSIGEGVFEGCDAMKTTNYVGATYIGNDDNPYLILYKGLNEETVKVHKDCQAIHSNAFLANNNLKNISFEKDDVLKTISANAFTAHVEKDSENKEIILGKAPQIVNISIPSSVTTIGDRAFKYCEDLVEVNFAENSKCTNLGVEAFEYCKKLQNVNNFVNTQIIKIGDYCFRGCESLKSIEIPNTVTIIKKHAFWGNKSLTSVTFEKNSNLAEFEMYVFRDTSLTSVILPKSLNWLDYGLFGRTNLKLKIYFEGDKLPNERTPGRWNEYGKVNDVMKYHENYYFYSATQKAGCWRYVNGEPTVW